jgi:Ser/Thr protein kinase RdoA (MazF antagonist)
MLLGTLRRRVSAVLDVESATAFLIDRGLIDGPAAASGSYTVRDASRRNRNLRVEGADGGGYLIKQPDPLEDDAEVTLRNEAAFHRLCLEEPALAVLRGMIPRLVDHDAERAVVVFELVPGAVPLRSSERVLASPTLLAEAGRALGEVLGTLHRTCRPLVAAADPRLSWLTGKPPGVLKIHQPLPRSLESLSPANVEVLKTLQSDGWQRGWFEGFRGLWRPETIVHGDVAFDNVLVLPPAGGPGADQVPAEVRVVDWELVRLGDPAWDVAGALQEFLFLWVHSMPVSSSLSAAEMTAGARYPLAGLRGAIRATWQGYRRAARLAADEAAALLRRAVPYSAARLVQSVFELSYESDRLSARSVVLLQLAANILNDPGSAQVQLYGIPSGPYPG